MLFCVVAGSPAAEAGLMPGSCVLRVGERDVLQASHDTVVGEVKRCLQETEGAGPMVDLKISRPHVEHLVGVASGCDFLGDHSYSWFSGAV